MSTREIEQRACTDTALLSVNNSQPRRKRSRLQCLWKQGPNRVQDLDPRLLPASDPHGILWQSTISHVIVVHKEKWLIILTIDRRPVHNV